MIGRRYVSAIGFDDWVRRAQPGKKLCYFRGDIAQARAGRGQEARAVNELAKTVMAYTGEELPVISPCYHVRGFVKGPQMVRVHQVKDGSGWRQYIAIKR